MVVVFDMGNEFPQQFVLPVSHLLGRTSCLFFHFQGIKNLVEGGAGHCASLFKTLIAAATVVDSKLLKNTGSGWIPHCHLAHGLRCHHSHLYSPWAIASSHFEDSEVREDRR